MKANKPFCKLCTYVHNILKDYFAPYLLQCNYGTNKLFWRLKDAEAWLAYCGPSATVKETYNYRVLIARIQGA